MNGDADITIKEQEKYEDAGVTAVDDRDGDITNQVVKEGYVDVYRAGTYTLTYTATDSSGNTAQATRNVTVEKVEANTGDAIYLTFDDGPSSDVTVRILDTLKTNGIKATFFICDYDEDKLPIIKRMIDYRQREILSGRYDTVGTARDGRWSDVYGLECFFWRCRGK